jgi:hypothetical protein
MGVTPKLPQSINEIQHPSNTRTPQEMQRPERVPEITPEELAMRRRQRLVKWSQIIALIFFVLEVVIAFRVGLKLIAANPASPFANFVYQMTALFLAPFAGLTMSPTAEGAILEIPALIAMAAYAVLYWLILRGMWVIFDPARARDAGKYKPDV